jgi:hypothetical protein
MIELLCRQVVLEFAETTNIQQERITRKKHDVISADDLGFVFRFSSLGYSF